jgi:hypothetical protein
MNTTTTYSPITLAIAAALEGLMTPIVKELIAPLTERLAELEKTSAHGEPTPSFIEKVRDAVLADDEFDGAVEKIISANDAMIWDIVEDNVTDCVSSALEGNVTDKVHDVLKNGSFTVEFNRY